MTPELLKMAETAGAESCYSVLELPGNSIAFEILLEAFARLVAEDCADVAESGVFCRECGGAASARAIRQKYGT